MALLRFTEAAPVRKPTLLPIRAPACSDDFAAAMLGETSNNEAMEAILPIVKIDDLLIISILLSCGRSPSFPGHEDDYLFLVNDKNERCYAGISAKTYC
ncbi:hypothetical protein [Sphingobium sp. CECT 9361]|uniref:hypothetical protein n=1 Tax=Sphingobium sp. CECT 9361 TaxID=2845384 RepID=UPI001E3ABDA1|nr:hypothetical protein [Sphingobium sp. CECT 9361]